jgi:glyoxylase-like metal-dependent hydrolase (beta-lactamase superfamily II)
MTNLAARTLGTVALALACAAPLSSQSSHGPPNFTLQEVVPGIYTTQEPREWMLSLMAHGNTMFVVNERDVFAVDANRTPAAAQKTLDLLRGVTKNPVRQLLVTHWHGDHWFGMQAFQDAFPGLQVIATDTARTELTTRLIDPIGKRNAEFYAVASNQHDSIYNAGVDYAGRPHTPERRKMVDLVRKAFRHYYAPAAQVMRLSPPDVTFERSMRLHSGKRVIELLHVGFGDTPGDAVAWLPAEGVLAAGDMLVHPVPYGQSPTPSQWAKSLRAIRALNPRHIVPGHGDVLRGTAYLDLVIETVEATVGQVRQLESQGVSLEDVQKRVTMDAFRTRMVPANDPVLADRWEDFLGAMVRNAYSEAAAARK